MSALLPSAERERLIDEALVAHTKALRAAGHLPLRQGFTWECARCGEQAYWSFEGGLTGPMSQHNCGRGAR